MDVAFVLRALRLECCLDAPFSPAKKTRGTLRWKLNAVKRRLT
jgi:hypothetical protein